MHRAEAQPNILRAIQRSRDARSRRRRRRALVIAASALVGLPVALSLSLVAFPDNEVVQAAATRAQSLVDLISQRSPGARTQGELTKTKRLRSHRAVAEAPALPGRHPFIVPPIGRPPELAELLASPPAVAGLSIGPLALLEGGPPPSLIGTIGGPPPSLIGTIGAPPASGPVSPPGGSDTPVTNPAFPPEPLGPSPSAVPEPGTWAMMIVGFGFIGWRLRSKKAAGRNMQRA
jgi:hypothetical protein